MATTTAFSHGNLVVEVSPAHGAIVAIRSGNDTVCACPRDHADFTLALSDAPHASTTLVGSSSQPLPDGGLRVVLEYDLLDGAARYRVIQELDLLSNPDRVVRTLRVRREHAGERSKLTASAMLLRGLGGAPESASTLLFSVPMARMKADRPHEQILQRPRRIESLKPVGEMTGVFTTAPDTATGAVTARRAITPGQWPAPAPLHLAVFPLPDRCPVKTYLFGDDGRVVVEHEFDCENWLQQGTQVIAARQVVQAVNGEWRDGLHAIAQQFTHAGFAPPTNRPAWIGSASIYEIDLADAGGFAGVQARLAEIADTGFDTIYLMPWHTGGYGTIDYLSVEPRYGTSAQLRELVDTAHATGLKVLFDLLVNIASPKSRYLTDHPDWFYLDESGKALPHPAWKATCFDAASPGFRRFLVDYAVRCCSEWDADGFRVDAVAYRGGNWNGRLGLQPHEHAHAVFSLVGEIRDAIRAAKPDAAMLAECFGPAQVPVSDSVCYQWIEWLDWAWERLPDGRINGVEFARILAEQFAILPPGTWFNLYTHTHDTVAFAKKDVQGIAIDAAFSTLALVGAGVMQFAGGWNMRARPSDEERPWYRALLRFRQSLGGVAGDAVRLPVRDDDPALFIAERPSQRGAVRVVTNFSARQRPLRDSGQVLFSRLGSSAGQIAPYDTVVLTAPVAASR